MPHPEPKPPVRILPVLRIYAWASLRHPWLVVISFAGVLLAQAAGLITPIYIKKFINVLASGVKSTETVHATLVVLTIFAAFAALGWLGRRISSTGTQEIEATVMAELEDEAFSMLIRQDYDFFISNFVGTLTRRVTRYSRAYEQLFDSLVQTFLPAIFFATGAIIVLGGRSLWLGAGLLAWVIVFIVIQLLLTKWRHPLRIARVAEDSRLTGAVSDAVGNHTAITFFAGERHEEERVAAITESWRAVTLRSWRADSLIRAVQDALAIAIEVGLMVGAVFLWQDGLITVGDFALIQLYVIGLVGQVWNIGNSLRRVYDAFADASEMVDILQREVAITDTPDAKPLALTTGAIALDHVTFAFDPVRPVLEDFSLAIRGGEKIALVGPSGAGKSTITRLLLRLYDPSAGAVTIDSQDLRRLTQESLRRAISYVPQESILFHRSLKENIAYGKPGATDEEVIEAAKRAHAHSFISALPQGYDTLVGERGVKLSGGERQRIAIARAILKDAPILILDEATASLDSESEAHIQSALADLMQGKTVIAIAHRLSTIMKMDRIVVMAGGRVALSGTHDELLSHGSNLYQKLWDIQAGGFIRAED